MRKRKGQFFIISAVIILIVLFNLSEKLNLEWRADISGAQANDASLALQNIKDSITAAVVASASDTERLKEMLKSTEIAQRNSLKERYYTNIYYNITDSDVTANVTLKSTDLYVEKTFVVPR